MNNEAKVRRKTQSKILGTARIMSYEDIELARAERAEKDTAKEATGKRKRGRPRKAPHAEEGPVETEEGPAEKKRGRKRKSIVLDADGAEASAAGPVPKVARTNETQVEEPQRVPEARMW